VIESSSPSPMIVPGTESLSRRPGETPEPRKSAGEAV